MSRKIAILLKGYPRLSETFIAQEILALEQVGFDIEIISLRHPTDKRRHPVHEKIQAPVTYLPEYLYHQPLRVLKGWWHARRLPGYKKAKAAFFKDLKRDFTTNRGRRFGQALVLARELAEEREWLYVHFLHTPGSVGRYTALMRGLPWSVSAHARDIWTIPEWEKEEKLAEMNWLVTCTAFGHKHLQGLAQSPERVHLVYHGLDLRAFKAGERKAAPESGQPVTLLSVGRAVPKKGYEDLLEALAMLPESLAWRMIHIGGGELSKTLKARAESLGLSDRIEWRGAQAQEAVLAAYRESDLFILASRIAGDGDRDGLPNVLMEAQSQGLACLSTEVSAIPELIRHKESGWLVPPEDPKALAGALARLIADPALRARLGEAGRARVRQDFSFENCIGGLISLFEEKDAQKAAQ